MVRPDLSRPARDHAAKDAAFFGITLPPEEDDPQDGLWEEHVPAMEAFLTVSGQWRTVGAGMGGILWLGLDYSAVRAGLDLAGTAITPDTLDALRVIEHAAKDELNNGR